jgi:hypothetical protein
MPASLVGWTADQAVSAVGTFFGSGTSDRTMRIVLTDKGYLVAAAVALTLAASCSSSTQASLTASTAATSTTSVPPEQQPMLRASPTVAFACPKPPVLNVQPTRRIPESAVSQLVVCPLADTSAVIVTPGSGLFTRLARALSAPDPPPTNLPCPAYGNAPQDVIARTTSGPMLIEIPVDDCEHYQTAVLSALSASRG